MNARELHKAADVVRAAHHIPGGRLVLPKLDKLLEWMSKQWSSSRPGCIPLVLQGSSNYQASQQTCCNIRDCSCATVSQVALAARGLAPARSSAAVHKLQAVAASQFRFLRELNEHEQSIDDPPVCG